VTLKSLGNPIRQQDSLNHEGAVRNVIAASQVKVPARPDRAAKTNALDAHRTVDGQPQSKRKN